MARQQKVFRETDVCGKCGLPIADHTYRKDWNVGQGRWVPQVFCPKGGTPSREFAERRAPGGIIEGDFSGRAANVRDPMAWMRPETRARMRELEPDASGHLPFRRGEGSKRAPLPDPMAWMSPETRTSTKRAEKAYDREERGWRKEHEWMRDQNSQATRRDEELASKALADEDGAPLYNVDGVKYQGCRKEDCPHRGYYRSGFCPEHKPAYGW